MCACVFGVGGPTRFSALHCGEVSCKTESPSSLNDTNLHCQRTGHTASHLQWGSKDCDRDKRYPSRYMKKKVEVLLDNADQKDSDHKRQGLTCVRAWRHARTMPSTPRLPKPPGTSTAWERDKRVQACLYASGFCVLLSSSSSAASTHSISSLRLHFRQACCIPEDTMSARLPTSDTNISTSQISLLKGYDLSSRRQVELTLQTPAAISRQH